MDEATDKYKTVLQELYNIVTDPENKPADRISAAKLLLDYIREGDSDSDIRVVFEGIPDEFSG